jgi:hypothetical protein
MTAQNPPVVSSSTNKAVVAAALVGGLILGGLLAFLLTRDPGDEPPIRVKNRSIEFEVVHRRNRWREIAPNDKMHWRLSGGAKNTPDLEIYVAPSDATKCPNGVFKAGSKVTFVYGDGNTADIEVTIASDADYRTTLTSNKPLEFGTRPNGQENRKVVLYKGQGEKFIQRIAVESTGGGKVDVCTFTARDANLGAIVVEAGG